LDEPFHKGEQGARAPVDWGPPRLEVNRPFVSGYWRRFIRKGGKPLTRLCGKSVGQTFQPDRVSADPLQRGKTGQPGKADLRLSWKTAYSEASLASSSLIRRANATGSLSREPSVRTASSYSSRQ